MTTRFPAGDLFAIQPLAAAVALGLGVLAVPAHAQSQAPASAQAASAPIQQLPRIVVSATRTEASEDEVPATISSKTGKDVDRQQARDLKSLLDDEPGVTVRAQPARMSAVFGATGRGGNEGVNIRGLEGNQVLLQTDGVRLPMSYASGPYAAGRGDYIDVEAFKRVELLRGPSSTSYGSDGLSGAVSFLTKDPSDLLTRGKPLQAALKLGYSSVDTSHVAVPSIAVSDGAWEAMLLASLRRGSEISNQGEVDTRNWSRTTPNPQDRRSDYLLGKAVYKLDNVHRFKLSAEHLDRTTTTDPVYTVIGMPNVNANITSANAKERVKRSLGKLDYQYTDPRNSLFQRASAHVYAQDTENRQFGEERYNAPPASWSRRTRDTRFGERSTGLGGQLEGNFGREALTHRVLVGADYSTTRVHSLKDGAHYDASGNLITTGSSSASASLPNQSFPDTDHEVFGAFVQDEIGIGTVSVIPALRFDRFVLDPEAGNWLFTRNNAIAPTRLSGSELSPRLGVVWRLLPEAQPYAQYGHGFHAPTPWQVNGGVSNQGANPPYRSIGNPDLKPETSNAIELGLRGRLLNDDLRYKLAVFRSRYRNFILSDYDVTATTTVPLDPGMAPNTRTFQSVNVARADIQGVEAGVQWRFLSGWTADVSYAHARGDQVQDGVSSPLPTIEPDKGVLKLRHEIEKRWGGELSVTGQRSQRRPYTASLHVPKGYWTADLAGWWDITPQLQVNAAITNLADAKYVLWSDVRGLTAASASLADAYSQPGRAFSASLRYQF
jgi:hemoglobin/transferrin/lactoferrin receptor protein